MQFKQLKEEVKALGFNEIRIDADSIFEAVIVKKSLAALTPKLDKFFGAPVWPSQNPLSLQAKEVIKDQGGIWPGQTLYFWYENNISIFAMLWPWSDGQHITLKCGYK
jgi:hypothetical protein